MTRTFIMLIVALLMITTCGNMEIVGNKPTAVLKVPSVALVNTPVLLDAASSSDQNENGNIVLYIFIIDNSKPEFIQDKPILFYTFTKTGKYQITLEVQDNDGYTNSTTRIINIVEELPVSDASEESDKNIVESEY